MQNTSEVGSLSPHASRCAAAAAAAVPRSKPSPAQPSQPVCGICLHDCLDPSPACLANPIPTHASEPTAWSSPRHDWYRVSHNRNEQQHARGPAHAPAAPIVCALALPTPYHTSPPPAPTRARLTRRPPPAPSRHPLAARSLHLASDSTAAPPSLRFAPTQRGEETETGWKKPLRERCTNHYRLSRDTHLPVRPRLPTHPLESLTPSHRRREPAARRRATGRA